MSLPLISVVTAAFNPGPELLVPARSLAAQGVADIEWIIVDDGSAPEEATHFDAAREAACVPVEVITQANAGQAAARNRGIAAARGTYVKILDADDALSEGHLAALLEASRALPPSTHAFAPTRHVYTRSGRTFVNRAYESAGETAEDQLACLLDTPFLHHGGVLWPRELLQRLSPYDETLATDEDGDLLIRVLLEGQVFQAVPDAAYLYRHDTSRPRVSRDDGPEKRASRLEVCRRVEVLAEAGTLPLPVRRALARRLDRLALSAWTYDRAFAKAALAEAKAVVSDYEVPGRRIEQQLRRALGIGAAVRVMAILRALRPRMV